MPIAWTITLAFVVSISQPLIIPYVAFAQKTVDVTKTIKFADSLLKSRQIDSAIAVYTALSTQVSKHSAEEAQALIGLGQGYLLKNQLDTALVHLHHAFACLKSLPNEITLHANAYSAAGVVHARMKHFDHAISYLDKALQLLESPNADRLKVLVNLGGVYLDQGSEQEAKNTFTEALALAQMLDAAPISAVIHTNLSNLYINLEDWSLAESHAERSLHIRDSLGATPAAITLNNLGYAQVKLKKTEQGTQNYQTALQWATPFERVQLLDNLQEVCTQTGNFQQANQYLSQLLQLKDSLYQINLDEKIATINAVYETAEKQQQINNLQATNELRKTQFGYLAIAVIFVLIGITLFVRFRLRHIRMKQALEQSQLKQRLLQAQLNPHFIFNVMNCVQQFIYAHDVEKSTAYLRDFATLTRLTLESSDNPYVSLSAELDMLNHYLRLQQLGSDPAFTFHITVDPKVIIDEISIPVMLIQPFVENAVIHGVRDRENGEITLSVKQAEPHLMVTICDNGRGMPQTLVKKPTTRRSFGLGIIDQRIHEYNKANTTPITKTVSHAQDDPNYPGTCVSLLIPIA